MIKKYFFILSIFIFFIIFSLQIKALDLVDSQGLKEIDGKLYYFDQDGYMQKGFVTIEDKTYFFSYANGTTKTGWQTIDGENWFYCKEDGTIAKGFYEVEGKTYYFDDNGYMQKGFVTIEDKTYFFSYTNGTTKTGWQTTDGTNWFYCKEDGSVAEGFQRINDKLYYFSIANHYLKKEGFQSVDGENWFYTYEDGSVAEGFQRINDKLYYFSIANHYLKKEGFQSVDGENWFYTYNDGSVAVGNVSIDGRNYSIGDDGIISGFIRRDGQLYYYNPDGSIAVGVQKIVGKYFLFDSDGIFQGYATTAKVIDVSSHNGVINWNSVKNSGQVYGVILRIGFWNIEDAMFASYISELKKLNIPYGIYLFSYAINGDEAIVEANFTNYIIEKYDLNPTLGIYFDLESWSQNNGMNSNGISAFQYDEMAKNFINIVNEGTGNRYKVKIYANLDFTRNRFGTYTNSQVDWIAQYNDYCTYTGLYSMWQYTSSGSIPGINGNVDISVLYIKQ